MRIAIGADHAGVSLKEDVKRLLDRRRIAYRDFGTQSEHSVDYPDFAAAVSRAVASGAYERGILICGTGIGMAIAANKIAGIRAAPVVTPEVARLSREHNNANVLALGARTTSYRWWRSPSSRRSSTRHLQVAVTSDGSTRLASSTSERPAIVLPASWLPVMTREDRRVAQELDALSEIMQRSLSDVDPDIARAIRDETSRQANGLELIASENFVSRAVLEAAGSVFTNKYAEGYPGRRYYGGCEFVDVVESLAISRAKALFGAEHANVQPHSGAQANMAAYFCLIKPGDTVLGMNLAHGGHLTHGHPLNFSGRLYNIVPYGVRREDERIDYDELARLADEHRPKMIMVGASAYPRIIDFARIRESASRVGAAVVTDMAHIAGLVAAGVHPSPVPHSDLVTTTTHKTLRGPRAGMVLCREPYAKELDKVVFPGLQGGPLVHVIAAKAICLKEAAEPSFADYQRQVAPMRGAWPHG